MTERLRAIDPSLVWWIASGVITTAAFWIGLGPSAALIAGLWMGGIVTVLAVGRTRSDAVRAILGTGDERDLDVYRTAMVAAGTVLGLIVTGSWLVSVLQGRPDPMLFTLTMVFSGTFFGTAIVATRTT
jgi:hypothetical protein